MKGQKTGESGSPIGQTLIGGAPRVERSATLVVVLVVTPPNLRLQRTRPASLPRGKCVTIARRGPRR